jgi:hypothetical protein
VCLALGTILWKNKQISGCNSNPIH